MDSLTVIESVKLNDCRDLTYYFDALNSLHSIG